MKTIALSILLLAAVPAFAQDVPAPMRSISLLQDRPVLLLSTFQIAGQVADGLYTVQAYDRHHLEADPVARFLIGQPPSWPRMIAFGAAEDVLTAYIGHKMRMSHGWERHIWWAPQVLTGMAHIAFAVNNSRMH